MAIDPSKYSVVEATSEATADTLITEILATITVLETYVSQNTYSKEFTISDKSTFNSYMDRLNVIFSYFNLSIGYTLCLELKKDLSDEKSNAEIDNFIIDYIPIYK